VGGPLDNADSSGYGVGAAWVFTRSGGVWTQQGSKLVGSGAVGAAEQGSSVALSADGNTAIVGGSGDNSYTGAAWVFVQSTIPSLQLSPTTDIVSSGNPSGPFTPSSFQYQLSATAGSILNFNNTTNSQGNTTREALLVGLRWRAPTAVLRDGERRRPDGHPAEPQPKANGSARDLSNKSLRIPRISAPLSMTDPAIVFECDHIDHSSASRYSSLCRLSCFFFSGSRPSAHVDM
jgi:hypothetical protein